MNYLIIGSGRMAMGIVHDRIKDKSVLHQELSIPPGLFLQELEKRNIKFEINERQL